MDKQQAEAAAEAIMAKSKDAQSRRDAQLSDLPKPNQKLLRIGLGLVGFGAGLSIGTASGHGVLFAGIGFVLGFGIAFMIGRRQV